MAAGGHDVTLLLVNLTAADLERRAVLTPSLKCEEVKQNSGLLSSLGGPDNGEVLKVEGRRFTILRRTYFLPFSETRWLGGKKRALHQGQIVWQGMKEGDTVFL